MTIGSVLVIILALILVSAVRTRPHDTGGRVPARPRMSGMLRRSARGEGREVCVMAGAIPVCR